jgi:predicted amidohydrolase YtcJ
MDILRHPRLLFRLEHRKVAIMISDTIEAWKVGHCGAQVSGQAIRWTNQSLVVLSLLGVILQSTAIAEADRVFVNGQVVTMTSANDGSEAVAVRHGKIIAVGSNSEIRQLATAKTEIIDLDGRTMLPGFFAAHDHFPQVGRTALFEIDLNSPPMGSVENMAQLIGLLREKTAEKAKGEWIVGRGYDDTLLEEKRHPTRWDLDQASTEHPIWIIHTSGHLGVANSLALQRCKIDRHTPQPDGGRIQIDAATGEPNGVFEEKLTLISSQTPYLTADQRLQTIKYCNQQYLAKGVTTTCIAGGGSSVIPDLYQALDRGWLQLRAIAMLSGSTAKAPTLDDLRSRTPKPEQIRYGAVKLGQDGSLQGYTGYLSQPYYQQPTGKEGYVGYAKRSREKLVESVLKYHRAGYQIAIHGNGDAAIDDILEAFQLAQQDYPRSDARHRIEHCQTPRMDQLDRMKELGITPSFFVAHVYYWGDRHRDLFLGPDRASRISPLASAQERHIRFTTHNDTPVTPVDPLHLVWCAVQRETRQGKILGDSQRIGVFEALQAITSGAAWQNFEEDSRGTIETGKLADLVIISENPLRIPSKEIKNIRVLATIVNGVTVFERP